MVGFEGGCEDCLIKVFLSKDILLMKCDGEIEKGPDWRMLVICRRFLLDDSVE